MSHSIHMRNCKIIAAALLHKGEKLNAVRKVLVEAFVWTRLLPGNAVTKALALARFKTEENYRNVKDFKRRTNNPGHNVYWWRVMGR